MRHVTRKDYLKFMSTLLSAVMIVVALPWNVFVSNADSGTHTNVTTVKVCDDAGNPVQGANVKLTLTNWSNNHWDDDTGADGIAEFPDYAYVKDAYKAQTDGSITCEITAPANSGYIDRTYDDWNVSDFESNSNHKDAVLERTELVDGIDFNIEDCDVTYDGESHSINVDIESSWGTTVYYSLDNSNWTEAKPVFTEAMDSKTVYVKVDGNGYYGFGSGTVTINRGELDDLSFTDCAAGGSVEIVSSIPYMDIITGYSESYANPVTSTNHDLSGMTIEYSSSDTEVNPSNGVVRVSFPGNFVISATVSGSDNFNEKTISYTLNARLRRQDFEFSTKNKTMTYGEDFQYQPNYQSGYGDVITYEIVSQKRDGVIVPDGDPAVATVDNNGNVTALTAGEVVIKATVTGDQYSESSDEYTLTINRAARTVSFANGSDTSLAYNTEHSYTITGTDSNDSITYSVSDPTLLEVRGQKIAVIDVDLENTVTITANVAQTDCYNATSCVLEVNTIKADQPNLKFDGGSSTNPYLVVYNGVDNYFTPGSFIRNQLSTGTVTYTLSNNTGKEYGFLHLTSTTFYYAKVDPNNASQIIIYGQYAPPAGGQLIKVTASDPGDDHYNGKTFDAYIRYAVDNTGLQGRYSIDGDQLPTGWFTEDVTISATTGYSIAIASSNNTAGAVWGSNIVISNGDDGQMKIVVTKNDGTVTASLSECSCLFVKNNAPNGQTGCVYVSELSGSGDIQYNTDKIQIDYANPYNLTVDFEEPFYKTLLNAITFGYYSASTTVVLSATDDGSGIDRFAYALYDDSGIHEIINVDCDPLAVDDEDNPIPSNTRTASFPIDPQFRGKVFVRAIDVAGRTVDSYVNSNGDWVPASDVPINVDGSSVNDYCVIVDSTKPVINVHFSGGSASNGIYYNAARKATITINEANFDNPQAVNVTVIKYSDDNHETVESSVNRNADGSLFRNSNSAVVDFNDEGVYRLVVNYTDLSGNVAAEYDSKMFIIDMNKPKVSISFDKTLERQVDNIDYYRVTSNRSPLVQATLKIEDYNFLCEDDFVSYSLSAANASNSTWTGKVYLSQDDGTLKQVTLSNLLEDPDNWIDSGIIHTCKFYIEEEAIYTLNLRVKDRANTGNVDFSKKFCFDGTKPSDLRISYDQTPLKALINTLTLGLFFDDTVTVTISSTDEVSQINYFNYAYAVDDGVSSVNNGGNGTIQRSEITFNGSSASASFEIPAQFRGQVSFSAYDMCGNTSSAANGEEVFPDSSTTKYPTTVVVDNIAPKIDVVFDNNSVVNDKYFNNLRTVTMTVEEANFFEELMVITITKDGTPIAIPYSFDPVAGEEDKYQAIITFEDDGDYTFDISGSDYSGNQAIVTYDEGTKAANDFVIDTTAPVVTVAFDNEDVHGTHYFNRERTVTVTFVEHNFDADESHLLVKSVQVNPPAVTWTHDGDTHTAVYKFESEGQYTFDIECQDKAENEFVYSSTSANADWDRLFVIDMSAPTDLTIMIDDTDDILGDYSGIETETIIPREDSNILRRNIATRNDVVFDKFYMNTITIKLNADFSIAPMPDDGTGRLEYQMVDKLSNYSVDGTWTTYDPAVGITVDPSQKFILFVRATDLADNETIVNSTGIIVDNHEPEGERHAPDININPSAPNANGFYNHNVDVSLTVVDPAYIGDSRNENGYYSGINKVICNVHADDIGESETQVLYDRDAGTNEGSITEQVDNLVHVWTDSITINANRFNSNNVIVEITSYDNAGNERITSTSLGDIKIDVTNPTIEVSYNNNSADLDNCFKADRVATIVITERNFNGADVRAAITSSNGRIPEVNGWTKTAGTGNGDNTKWTATVTYNTDGDYTFDIAYTDLADNAAGAANYGSSVAPTSFTIDKTLPTVNVTYDNNDAEHDMYYKAPRTATIVINEHNFIANRVNITVTATDDGANIAAPTISGWSNVGDRHTATITYDRDGRYTFDISVRDKAGNDSANYADDLFVVDTTAPSLTISGVKNNSANSGSVAPVLTYSDTNFDKSLVDISLVGANRGKVTLNGSYSEIHNGNIFNFNNFANTKENDDIYTLSVTITDLAGNASTQEITFSVNRFGSTYQLSEETEAIRGQYLQEPVDVVVTEVNANELSDIRITVFKNNDTIVLTEGVDYDVNVTGGNGQWYEYEYVIHSRNFNDDGVYRVVIHSQDSAGNISENTLDTKDESTIQFGIDKIKPNIVVSNLEKNTTYAFEQYTVRMSISDNLLLSSVEVYLDGKLLDPATWDAEQIAAIIAENGEFTFNVDSANHARNVKIVAKDAAGNIQEIEIDNFYVTTNMFIRFFTNTPLFVGSIIGIILLIALIIFIVVTKRKKKTR